MSDMFKNIISVFLFLLWQVWQVHSSDSLLNEDAARMMCSGYEQIPSYLLIGSEFHPLYSDMIFMPRCSGGANAFAPVYSLPASIPLRYTGDHTTHCLFTETTDSYYVIIDIQLFGELEVNATFSCPKPIAATPSNPDPFPPFQRTYIGQIPPEYFTCNYDSTVQLTLEAEERTVFKIYCDPLSFTSIFDTEPVEIRIANEGDPLQDCLFRNDIPSSHVVPGGSSVVEGVEVDVFHGFHYESTFFVGPCTYVPTTSPEPTTAAITSATTKTTPQPFSDPNAIVTSLTTLEETTTMRPSTPGFSTSQTSPVAPTAPSASGLRDDDYILEVSPHCGSSTSDSAWVSGIADVAAQFTAVCRGGQEYPFTNINSDGVNFRVSVHYTGNDATQCVFKQRQGSEVYVISVIVSWGEEGQFVHQSTEEYQVSCTFSDKATADSSQQNLEETLIAAKAIQVHMGSDTTSTITLNIVDVLGVPVTFLPHGRRVQMRAESGGEGGDLGIRVVGCDAVGTNSNVRYAVVRAGCGDGLIFQKDEGFTNTGLVTKSPYFQVFSLEADNEIRFECNFTLCETACNGDSCSTERRRRNTPDFIYMSEIIGFASTPLLRLT